MLTLTSVSPSSDVAGITRFELHRLGQAGRLHVVAQLYGVRDVRRELDERDVVLVGRDVEPPMDVETTDAEVLLEAVLVVKLVLADADDDVSNVLPNNQILKEDEKVLEFCVMKIKILIIFTQIK